MTISLYVCVCVCVYFSAGLLIHIFFLIFNVLKARKCLYFQKLISISHNFLFHFFFVTDLYLVCCCLKPGCLIKIVCVTFFIYTDSLAQYLWIIWKTKKKNEIINQKPLKPLPLSLDLFILECFLKIFNFSFHYF